MVQKTITRKKTKLGIMLSLLMIGSIFAMAIAMADPEETNTQTLDNESEIIPQTTSDASLLADESTMPGEFGKVGLTRATYSQGWATNSDDQGYLVNALWVTQWFSKFSKDDAQNIREQVRNRNISLHEAKDLLKNAANESIIKKSAGRLHVGVGKDMDVYKLVNKDVSGDTVTFGVLPIDEKKDDLSASIGTLTLTAENLSDMTLWTGTLTLTGDKKAGTYDVSLASNSAQLRGLGQGKENPGNPGKPEDNGNPNNNSNKPGPKDNNGQKEGFWGRIGNIFKRNK